MSDTVRWALFFGQMGALALQVAVMIGTSLMRRDIKQTEVRMNLAVQEHYVSVREASGHD